MGHCCWLLFPPPYILSFNTNAIFSTMPVTSALPIRKARRKSDEPKVWFSFFNVNYAPTIFFILISILSQSWLRLIVVT